MGNSFLQEYANAKKKGLLTVVQKSKKPGGCRAEFMGITWHKYLSLASGAQRACQIPFQTLSKGARRRKQTVPHASIPQGRSRPKKALLDIFRQGAIFKATKVLTGERPLMGSTGWQRSRWCMPRMFLAPLWRGFLFSAPEQLALTQVLQHRRA